MFAKTVSLFAAFALTAPAAVQAEQTEPQVAVSYADLDLATSDGAARLDARIKQAVRTLCPADPGIGELMRHRFSTQCISETRVRVNPRVAEAVAAARTTARG